MNSLESWEFSFKNSFNQTKILNDTLQDGKYRMLTKPLSQKRRLIVHDRPQNLVFNALLQSKIPYLSLQNEFGTLFINNTSNIFNRHSPYSGVKSDNIQPSAESCHHPHPNIPDAPYFGIWLTKSLCILPTLFMMSSDFIQNEVRLLEISSYLL